jgi:hypothetical protein
MNNVTEAGMIGLPQLALVAGMTTLICIVGIIVLMKILKRKKRLKK